MDDRQNPGTEAAADAVEASGPPEGENPAPAGPNPEVPWRGTATVLSLDLGGGLPGAAPGDGEFKARLASLVLEHDGLVAEPREEDILAVWEWDRNGAEGPERAVRAALAAKDLMAGSGGPSGASLASPFRIGIHTGFAALDEAVGAKAPSASGEALDAARLLRATAPQAGIFVSRDAYRHIRGIFDVTVQDTVVLEGRTEPLETYLVDRAKPRAFRIPSRGFQGIETRTVGREGELRTLEERYREATEESQTRVVVVIGEAGLGKSRLLEEFEAWLELLPERILFFKGKATPETGRRPNGLFRDVLSFRFDIRESDPVQTVREKVRAGLSPYLETDRADVVAQWLGFDFTSSEAVAGLLGSRSFRQQALADLVRVFRTLAQRPVVVFLEDLHWADEGSLFLVEHLAAEIPDGRLLIVGVGRPALLERAKPWGDGSAAFSTLHLQPLSEGDCFSLVGEILQKADGVPEDLREEIVRISHGNPFYAEELIGLLLDRGIILTGGERWKVDGEKLARTRLPSTLKGVLKARLDDLPPDERRLLQCASVLGRHFWEGAVAEISSADPAAAAPAAGGASAFLETARERQFIFHEEASSFEESREFLFKHDILRDYVYDTVVHKVRRAYHAQVARWLERNLKGRQSEHLTTIAEHFEAAGEKERAADYHARAGEEQARVSAFRHAVASYERALTLLPASKTVARAVVLAGMGDACRQLGDYGAARRHSEQALVLSRRAGDARTEIVVLSNLGKTNMVQGQYAEAKPMLAEALSLASRKGDRQATAQVLLNLADAAFRLGEADTAMSCAQESLQIFTGFNDPQGIAGAHRVLGFACMMLGDFEETVRHHQQGLDIFREAGDRWGVATCLINLGETHRKMGRLEDAVAYWEKSLPLAREIGARLSVAISYVNMGGVLAAMDGQEGRACRSLRDGILEATAIGSAPIVLEALVSVSLLYFREAEPLRAARLLGAVMAHPSFNDEIQQYSDPLLKRIEARSGPDILHAALDWGRARDFAAVVDEVIRELDTGARG